MRKKTLLIAGGGSEATHGIARARDMGLHVVVSDQNPQAPGFALADDKLVVSIDDAEATTEAALAYHRNVRPIDGVICLGAGVPLTVATVARRLGLPGIAMASAYFASDKLAMKERFQAHGVATPWFASVRDEQELAEIVAERGRDLVVKPVDGRGAQRLDTGIELIDAFARAKEQSPAARVMVEDYLEGPRVSTESIVLEGAAYTPGFADRNYEHLEHDAPCFVENGGDLPSRLPPLIQHAVCEAVEAAARAIGIANGNVAGDIVVHKGRPHVIELAAQLSGGYCCTREIPLNTGVDFAGCVIRMALGEPVSPDDLRPKFKKPVVQRYVFPEAGRIVRIEGLESARAIPGIEEIVVNMNPGDLVPEAVNSEARAAMVLATGDSADAALAAANAALGAIRVHTAPLHREL